MVFNKQETQALVRVLNKIIIAIDRRLTVEAKRGHTAIGVATRRKLQNQGAIVAMYHQKVQEAECVSFSEAEIDELAAIFNAWAAGSEVEMLLDVMLFASMEKEGES